MLALKLKTVLVFAVLSLAFACNHVRIADLQRDPGKYAGKEVTVAGRVNESFGMIGNGAYQVDDGSGTIWIISEGYGVPGNGAKVAVTGTLFQGASFGGRAFGLALKQTKRR
jgi:hypothetical protein